MNAAARASRRGETRGGGEWRPGPLPRVSGKWKGAVEGTRPRPGVPSAHPTVKSEGARRPPRHPEARRGQEVGEGALPSHLPRGCRRRSRPCRRH